MQAVLEADREQHDVELWTDESEMRKELTACYRK
jgi:hypothetical protein